MNAREFIDLAERLADGATEAEFRTSVSRAYYGAFHTALELLAAIGVVLPSGPEAHQKLRFCLAQCGEPTGMEAGANLHLLRRERNIADYDLEHEKYKARRNTLLQLHLATNILVALDACGQEPAYFRFRARVRHYASQTLRLPISN